MLVRLLPLLLVVVSLTRIAASCGAENAAADKQVPDKALPLPGETFVVDGCPAFLIPAKEAAAKKPTPWVWYAPTLPGLPENAEKWMFERFTNAGIAIAGIDVGESFGSPQGRAKFSALYQTLVGKKGMSPKPILLGRSRGGLMVLSWACDNADKVGGIAGIYPVYDITSYPGVDKAAGAYQLTTEELQAALAKHNPPQRLDALAKARVPMFAIHGDVDVVVPLEKNSGAVAVRYAALGGKMELIVPKGQGHNMWPGFFECRELVDFVLKNAAAGNAK